MIEPELNDLLIMQLVPLKTSAPTQLHQIGHHLKFIHYEYKLEIKYSINIIPCTYSQTKNSKFLVSVSLINDIILG